ncbi:MAG: PEP-CTERM sorting domain-containing protein [Coleofasciculus sp. B1-GNL1-01]|uniref:PEP-CTERM sorting domain-containing protein n=1 Tax=Coleofasciculus sp. B1-GNL1-01 TaxID=3068484 RepID=UPI0032FEBCCE
MTNIYQKLALATAGTALGLAAVGVHPAQASKITFDELNSGVSSFSFDGDGNGINDIVFSTTDSAGFNTVGPGSFMSYIQEPGLEGTTLLDVDLRADFLFGAEDYLTFGFALDDFFESSDTWAALEVYDSDGNLLASDFEFGQYTSPDGISQGNFPEGIIETSFTGVASYALFDFNNDNSGGQRYIIDNFEGVFGDTEVSSVPEPLTILGSATALGFGALFKRQQSRKQKKS